MAGKTAKMAQNTVENTETVNYSTPGEEKAQETAHMEVAEDRFIYIGPTTGTGLTTNTIFAGTREAVEEHLRDTLERIPQVGLLIVATKSLAESKAKVRKAGTILNKYYNDILSLSRK